MFNPFRPSTNTMYPLLFYQTGYLCCCVFHNEPWMPSCNGHKWRMLNINTKYVLCDVGSFPFMRSLNELPSWMTNDRRVLSSSDGTPLVEQRQSKTNFWPRSGARYLEEVTWTSGIRRLWIVSLDRHVCPTWLLLYTSFTASYLLRLVYRGPWVSF